MNFLNLFGGNSAKSELKNALDAGQIKIHQKDGDIHLLQIRGASEIPLGIWSKDFRDRMTLNGASLHLREDYPAFAALNPTEQANILISLSKEEKT
ncbi:MAG: hypothetical protein COY40_03200 [Alphaproteobacteria bacterium CG_4_10_14_0_8_um_filter_53_9]|nr:MAG: hypothetical protein COY40_03200 [Alphaproteobacteria bacterium CG_4_10_14_0_8_um_filter_53_9]